MGQCRSARPGPPRPALLRGCCRTTGLGGTWEIPNWSPTPVLHSVWCRESHLSPTPKRDDQIRATPMPSPQSRAPELPPKSPLLRNRTREITEGHCVVWGPQKNQTGQRITVPWRGYRCCLGSIVCPSPSCGPSSAPWQGIWVRHGGRIPKLLLAVAQRNTSRLPTAGNSLAALLPALPQQLKTSRFCLYGSSGSRVRGNAREQLLDPLGASYVAGPDGPGT